MPTTPTNVQASDGTSPTKVTVTSNPSSPTLRYDFYRSSVQGQRGTLIGSAAVPTFDDTPPDAAHYFYTVVASNDAGPSADSAQDEGYLAPPIGGGPLPAWLQGKPLNTWIQIPNSGLGIADAPAMIAELAATGLCNADGTTKTPSIGSMPWGITAYSGGTLKKDTSEFLLNGGGGAGGWAGNDVRVLKLSDDAPRWQVAKPSNPVAELRTTGSFEYLADGVTPNASHSAWSPIFNDAHDKLYVVGSQMMWPGDQGYYNHVNSIDWSVPRLSRAWDAPSANPAYPGPTGSNQQLWMCKDPATEKIYVGSVGGIYKGTPQGTPKTYTWTGPVCACTDGFGAVGLGVLLNIGINSRPLAYSINLATMVATQVTLVGMPTWPSGFAQPGFVFDSVIGAWLFFQDDGNLYKITRTNATTFTCSNMGIAGTVGSNSAKLIYGRMQYVPNLSGIVLLVDGLNKTYFVKTA